MQQPDPAHCASDAITLLLGALAWICGDDARAQRLLALTGIGVDDLRDRADDPQVLHAVGQFLCDHEPDLLACAMAMRRAPAELATATRMLAMEMPT